MPSQKTLEEYMKKQTQSILTSHQITPQYRITGFCKETQFQETPIGKIPKDWKLVKLKDIFEFQRGFSYGRKDISEAPSSIRFVTIDDVEKEGGKKRNPEPVYLKEDVKVDNRFLLRKGDLLIASTDMSKGFIIGAPLYIDDDLTQEGQLLVYSMDLTKLVPIREVNTKFFFYVLSWSPVRKIMKSFAQGTNVLHLNHDLAKNLNIPLPPLEEQWGVAEVLSTVDRAIEGVDGVVARLERLKKALMRELLTGRVRVREENGKLVSYRETEFQETSIGKIPRDWRTENLENIIELGHGERPKVVLKEGDVPIYGGGGLYGYTNEYLVNKPYILVLARVGKGSVGRVYLTRGKVWVTDNAIYGYSKDPEGVITVYTYYWLLFDRTWIEKYVRRSAGGYAIITLNSLKNLKVPFPSVSEQKKITEILSTIDKAIELYLEKKSRLERLKRSLMDLLLTGRVRVRVERVA